MHLKIGKNLSEKKIYIILFSVFLIYLAVPWAYFDSSTYTYNFLPKRICLLSLFVCFTLLTYLNNRGKRLGILLAFCAVFSLLGYQETGYFEKHYFIQLLYLELGFLFYNAPQSIKLMFYKPARFMLLIYILKFIFLKKRILCSWRVFLQ